MSRRPRHLVISGNDDCDVHRMSAEARCENYVHVSETTHVHFLFDIAYVDSTMAWRQGDGVDVRRERLAWCLDNAKSDPRKLFVIIKDSPLPEHPNITVYRSTPGWENLLDEWEGKFQPNVFFQEDKWRQNEPLEDFLSSVVQAWQSLQGK